MVVIGPRAVSQAVTSSVFCRSQKDIKGEDLRPYTEVQDKKSFILSIDIYLIHS